MDNYYDSPITVWRTAATKFEEYATNEIIRALQEYKLDIDKEKLLAALKHDKERYMDAYRKGYEAGIRSTKEKQYGD